jgi:hypothetical protein
MQNSFSLNQLFAFQAIRVEKDLIIRKSGPQFISNSSKDDFRYFTVDDFINIIEVKILNVDFKFFPFYLTVNELDNLLEYS